MRADHAHRPEGQSGMRRFFPLPPAPGAPATTHRVAARGVGVFAAVLVAFLGTAPSFPAKAARYQAQITLEPGRPESYAIEHVVSLPIGGRRHGLHGELSLRRTLGPGVLESWGGTLSLADGPVTVYLARDEDHRSSTEPFRLVHKSSRLRDTWAGVVQWRGEWGAVIQYVEKVPLRGRSGPLLTAQLHPRASWPRVTWVGYGSDALQHHFYVLDGSLSLTAVNLRWGAAWQHGQEAVGKGGSPALVSLLEGAGFARLEAVQGRHRVWMTLHGTTPGFRSLAADDYPFARGRVGLEGRWQFRPQTNHLLSVYGHWLAPLSDQFQGTKELEVRYSVSPRQRWAWHVGAARKWEGDGRALGTWLAGVRDPGRRLVASVEVETNGDSARWRPRIEWRSSGSRLLVSADSDLSGWRAQWVYTGHPLWEATVVYKERSAGDAQTAVRSWSHMRLVRRVQGFGEVWVRWNDWDLGRLDVGWSRPATVAVGFAVAL